MRYSKIIMASLPIFLAGCLDVFESDSDTFYTQPAPAPVSSAPNPSTGPTPGKPCPTTGQSDCGCEGTTPSSRPEIPSSAMPTSPSPVVEGDANWMPSEGNLVAAGDLIRDLQRKTGRTMLSHEEMAAHLRAHMKLTAPQVERVLEELGVGKYA